MFSKRAALLALLATISAGADIAYGAPMPQASGDSVEIGGQRLTCENVRARLDRNLPNFGVAVPGQRLLILNPIVMARQTRVVQAFVFHHECGHHRVGASEMKADCWAVEQGVRSGWLDRAGLKQVCATFEDAPETATHPSGARRCRNLDRCFAAAATTLAQSMPAATQERAFLTAGTPAAHRTAAPLLVSGPTLLWKGVRR